LAAHAFCLGCSVQLVPISRKSNFVVRGANPLTPLAMLDADSFTVVDLFGGAGGTGLGFLDAGFTILAAVDDDRHAAETYFQNLGVEVTKQDITKLSPRKLRRALHLRCGELDVLAGCPPCQGFTRLRNASGADDPRNRLVLRYLRFVTEFRPRFAVFENVSGMLDTKHGRAFHAKLLLGFRRRGYSVSEQVLEAADFGVPQFRRRVIIVAARRGYKARVAVPTHGAPDSKYVHRRQRRPWVTVRGAIGTGIFPPLSPGGSNERRGLLPNHKAAATGEKVCRFLRRVPRDGGSRSQVPRRYLLPCHRRHTGHADTYSRLAWNSPSNTITTGCTNPSKGRFVHPTQTRALSGREAATLQGFPLGYRFYGRCIDRQIGNAVPPPLALAVAKALREGLVARRRSTTCSTDASSDRVSSATAGITRRGLRRRGTTALGAKTRCCATSADRPQRRQREMRREAVRAGRSSARRLAA